MSAVKECELIKLSCPQLLAKLQRSTPTMFYVKTRSSVYQRRKCHVYTFERLMLNCLNASSLLNNVHQSQNRFGESWDLLCDWRFRQWHGSESQQGASDATLTSSLSFCGKTLVLFLRKSPSPTESWTEGQREREEKSFQWNDDSLVVHNTGSSQKSITMKCVSYVKLTESQPKWDHFVACQRLCVCLHCFAKNSNILTKRRLLFCLIDMMKKKQKNCRYKGFLSLYFSKFHRPRVSIHLSW